jgi:hypothetical protein
MVFRNKARRIEDLRFCVAIAIAALSEWVPSAIAPYRYSRNG